MTKYFLLTFSFHIIFSLLNGQDVALNESIEIQQQKFDTKLAGQLVTKSGEELIKYVNNSIRNSLLVIVGGALLNYDYDEENEDIEIRNAALGSLMILVGSFSQITNIFKIKKSGEYLKEAGKAISGR